MELMKTIFLLCALATYAQVVICHTDDWYYNNSSGQLAPPQWFLNYPDCNGSSQSPVNVVTDEVVYDSSLGPLIFEGWDVAPSWMTLTNVGHSAQVDFDYDAYLSGGGLPAKYRVQQFHFHWGDNMDVGSENSFNGFHYPLEMHIVLYSTDYPDFDSASQQENGLAVLSVFFQNLGRTNNYREILEGLKWVPASQDKVQLKPFALSTLLPDTTYYYYRYSGSLTTPGCYESVVWTLLSEPVSMTDSEINQSFRTLFNFNNKPLVNNFRPTQATNTRTVTANIGWNLNADML